MSDLIAMPIMQEYFASKQSEYDDFEEPVEILVKLAKEGEIDPWNIDIVEITDRFLQQIEKMERMDLRISGRTLHYAAILLRMKSNVLIEEPAIEDETWNDDLELFDIDDYPIPKPPVRRYSRRSVTLDELILELKKAEIVEQRRSTRKKTQKTIELDRLTTDQVLGIAHEEDIEGRIEVLRKQISRFLENKPFITLSEILGSDRSDNLMIYISLVFLANMKEIWIEQKELFGEIFISYPEANTYQRS